MVHALLLRSAPFKEPLNTPMSKPPMAPHSSPLAWKIPWTEEPGGLQSTGLLRVGRDSATSLSLFTSCIGEGNGNPLQCSCLENPRDGGAWWAAVYWVLQSRTRLKWLSSSSMSKLKVSVPHIFDNLNLFAMGLTCKDRRAWMCLCGYLIQLKNQSSY